MSASYYGGHAGELADQGHRSWTPEEIDALVRGYSDEQLRVNAASAAKQPGTVWDITLRAELRRRSTR